jgi:hypothetical protein
MFKCLASSGSQVGLRTGRITGTAVKLRARRVVLTCKRVGCRWKGRWNGSGWLQNSRCRPLRPFFWGIPNLDPKCDSVRFTPAARTHTPSRPVIFTVKHKKFLFLSLSCSLRLLTLTLSLTLGLSYSHSVHTCAQPVFNLYLPLFFNLVYSSFYITVSYINYNWIYCYIWFQVVVILSHPNVVTPSAVSVNTHNTSRTTGTTQRQQTWATGWLRRGKEPKRRVNVSWSHGIVCVFFSFFIAFSYYSYIF